VIRMLLTSNIFLLSSGCLVGVDRAGLIIFSSRDLNSPVAELFAMSTGSTVESDFLLQP